MGATWQRMPDLIKSAGQVGYPITPRQIERWVERGLLLSDRRSQGYGAGVNAYYPYETALALAKFLQNIDDLDGAGLWAWYQGCPVPKQTPKRLLYGKLKALWREVRRPPRQKTRGDRADRVHALAWRYRYRIRRLVGGTGDQAYGVAHQLLALVARLKDEKDTKSLLDSLMQRFYDRITQLGAEIPRPQTPPELLDWFEDLNVAALARVIRKAKPEEIEEAKFYLKAHLKLVTSVLVISGLVSPVDEPVKAVRTFVNQLPQLIAGILLLRERNRKILEALPADGQMGGS